MGVHRYLLLIFPLDLLHYHGGLIQSSNYAFNLVSQECKSRLTNIRCLLAGLYGQSTFRLVDLETGKVLNKTYLPRQYFGEGLSELNEKFYQLTWKLPDGFVYDRSLKKVYRLKQGLS